MRIAQTLICVVSVTIAACGSQPKVLDVPAPEGRKIHIDERLLSECRILTPLQDNPKPSEVLQKKGQDALAYSECAHGKAKLIKAIRAAFN